jgi:hypothetical protein
MMISLKSLFSVLFLLVCIATTTSAKRKDDEEAATALRDLQTGMAGLKEASQNPALLAQMMRDLQVRYIVLV